jgi:hypothetical protein
MKRCVLLFFPALLFASGVGAFEATIERVGSVAAAPISSVSKSELAPLPGVAISPDRPPAIYASEFRAKASSTVPSSVPVPSFNPVAVSFCLSDVL